MSSLAYSTRDEAPAGGSEVSQVCSIPIAAPARCAHCDLEVPRGLLDPGAELQFCCSGCRTVYHVLHENGLADYYSYRKIEDVSAQPALVSERGYGHFDDAKFHELYVRDEQETRVVRLLLEGVHCAACVWLVEKLPRLLSGVIEARLDLGKRSVTLRWDPAEVRLSKIAEELNRLGYPSHPPQAEHRAWLDKQEDRRLLIRMGVAGAAAGNTMMLAVALYSGLFGGMTAEYESFFRWASLLVAIPSITWSGAHFFKGAFAAISARSPHMDIPISIGLIAGFLGGTVNTFRGQGEIYFDTITTLIFILLIGRWLQRRYQRRAARAAELLYAMAPASARLVEGTLEQVRGGEVFGVREVPLEVVERGALVEIRAGERVAVDGEVVYGSSELDRSWLTGEPTPELVAEGDVVHAGTINISSRIFVEAQRTGQATRMGQLMQRVEEAQSRRAPIVLLADRISGYFLVSVLSLTALTLLIWRADLALGVEHAIALLIVTCPCALGMATPLAISASLGKAAQLGILVKGADVIEKLNRHGLMVFDKTGTLTEGRLKLTGYEGEARYLPWVLALERSSAHTIARALVAGLQAELGQEALGAERELEITEFKERLGEGVSARVNGSQVRIGNVTALGELEPWVEAAVKASSELGESPVLFSVDGRVVLVLSLGDPVRPEARDSIQSLRKLGYEIRILSGDHPATVRAVAERVGVAKELAEGGVSPEQKLARIEDWGAHQPVIMVGDGVNDAAALSAASVGIAVHGGAEASLQAADVFITRPGLKPVLQLVVGARRALGVVRRNLAFSLAYNALAVVLAMSGWLTPLLAAIMMPFASLTVVTNSYRSESFKP